MSIPITAQMVSELREKTGAGLLDCKKALTESNANLEEAITILRKKGAASAAKKADRTTKEGLIESYIHVGGKVGVLLEVNCETDFVARNEEFRAFCKDVCLQIAAANPLHVTREEVTWPRSARSPSPKCRASRPPRCRRSSRANSKNSFPRSVCSTSPS
jgi:elongation factor Ts